MLFWAHKENFLLFWGEFIVVLIGSFEIFGLLVKFGGDYFLDSEEIIKLKKILESR